MNPQTIVDDVLGLLGPLNGYKAYIGAAIYLGLAIFDLSQGNGTGAAAAFGLFMGIAGIRHAQTKLAAQANTTPTKP